MAARAKNKTLGKRYTPRGALKMPWVPGEFPGLEPHVGSQTIAYQCFDWSFRMRRMNDSTAALIWISPYSGENTGVDVRMYARTVSVDASMTLGPIKEIWSSPGSDYLFTYYGLSWGTDSTGDNFALAFCNSVLDDEVIHYITLDQELNQVGATSIDASVGLGLPGGTAFFYNPSPYVVDGVLWAGAFDHRYTFESKLRRQLFKITESGGSLSVQEYAAFDKPEIPNNSGVEDVVQFGDRLLIVSTASGGRSSFFVCDVSDPVGTIQYFDGPDVPVNTSDYGFSSSAYPVVSGGEGYGQIWAVPHRDDPSRVYFHGGINDPVTYPDEDAWPSVIELLWNGSGLEVVSIQQLSNVEPFYELQRQFSNDDVRFWGFAHDDGAFNNFLYALSFNGPGWPAGIKYNQNGELYIGLPVHERQPGPPFFGVRVANIFSAGKTPQDSFEFNMEHYAASGGKRYEANGWGRNALPDHILAEYQEMLNSPGLRVYEDNPGMDFEPGSGGVLVLWPLWMDDSVFPGLLDVNFSVLAWIPSSTPPLRQMQRNDTLSFRSGNARLNTNGRAGRATSIQEARAPRLPEGGQSYS